ncbi:MAG TPA: hypothetical protein VM662_11970 [Sphingomonas sp.]|nr:hypothetical protein [Sphingomonas sp.]
MSRAALAICLLIALPAESHPQPGGRTGIEGRWKTACVPIGKNDRHGFITTLEVRDDLFTAVSQLYAHSDCNTPTVRTHYSGRIHAALAHDGVIDVDHVVESIRMTLDDADVVEAYNKPGEGCGISGGWRLNTARPIDGRTCAPWTFPAAGTRLYERMWRTGDQLRIGSFPTVWTNTAPERRAATPGTLVFVRIGADR